MNPLHLLGYYYQAKMKAAKFRGYLVPPRNSLILDVGSGDGPSPSADVLCDRFVGDDIERTAPLRLDRPFVSGDVESLPFVDGGFDFVYCSHLLEHTHRPDAAMAELQRVGRAGYLEVPSEYLEKTAKSTPAHLWFVRLENGRLVFRPKRAGVLDPIVNEMLDQVLLGKDPLYTAFHWARFYSLFNIGLFWSEKIPHRVIGQTDPDRVADFSKGREEIDSDERVVRLRETIVHAKARAQEPPQTLRERMKRWVRRYYASGKTVDLQKLLACPLCKRAIVFSANDQKFICSPCRKWFPNVEGIPILTPSSARSVDSAIPS